MRTQELRLVLLDVDYTLIRPREGFEAAGYVALGRRVGVTLDATRFDAAQAEAVEALWGPAAPLDHRPEERERFPTLVALAMGADAEAAALIGRAAADAWDDPANFELYDDVPDALASLRAAGLTVGLISNTHRDLSRFLAPWRLDVDFALTSAAHGRSKPCPTIFGAALRLGHAQPHEAVMVGDSPTADIAGAERCGIRAVLLDRHGLHPDRDGERLTSLAELPALLAP